MTIGSAATRMNILNTSMDNLPVPDLLNQLASGMVFTPNVVRLMRWQRARDVVECYNRAAYKVGDSRLVEYACKFFRKPLKAKKTDSDLFLAFYQYHKDDDNIKIFLLGGREGVAQRAQYKINAKVGREIVVGSHSPSFGFETNEQECSEIIEKVNESGATVLAVGLGAAEQEKWMGRYKDKMPNVRIFLAIGAAIDFEAGCKARSPKWMSDLGIEWLHRLLFQPGRLWKRYLVDDLPFLFK